MTRTEQYLLALYIAEHRSSPPVSSGTVAELLDRSAAAATEKLQRPEAEGLVTYELYEGARLTEPGRERAEELHETYVVLSWFFREALDLDDHEREAMEMVGLVSRSVVERLAGLLSENSEGEIDLDAASSIR